MATSPKPQRTSQACNACKRRKVRCNGLEPCQQCAHHNLPCAYAAAPIVARGRSRMGAAERGAVIAESRTRRLSCSSASPSLSPANPEGSAYGLSFFHNLIPQFMIYVYPITPIIDEAGLRHAIQRMDTDNDAAACVYAYAGIVLLLMQNAKPWTPDCYNQAKEMMSLSIDHHKAPGFGFKPSVTRIMSRIFLQMSMLILHRWDMAFFYLSEAASLMLMQGLDNFLGEAPDTISRARRERMYWTCFIHERHLMAEAKTVALLDPLPTLPNVTGAAPGSVEKGWNYIIQTFLVVDKDFVRFWSGDRSLVTAQWIQTKHHQLTDNSWQQEVALLPIVQQADLIITRQWLRTLTWQIAMSNVLLSSDAEQSDGLSLFMPLRLSGDIRDFLTRMSSQAIEIYGMGLVEKLFEITTTIADLVLALPPGDYPEETESRIQDLLFAKQFLLGLAHIKPLHRKILQDKMLEIKALYKDTKLNHLVGNHDFY